MDEEDSTQSNSEYTPDQIKAAIKKLIEGKEKATAERDLVFLLII
jgi:hypothetical protein